MKSSVQNESKLFNGLNANVLFIFVLASLLVFLSLPVKADDMGNLDSSSTSIEDDSDDEEVSVESTPVTESSSDEDDV